MTDETVERVAQIIHEAMRFERKSDTLAWVHKGNSHAQDHARSAARAALDAMPAVQVKPLEWEDHPDRSIARAIGTMWECRAGSNWNLYTKTIGRTASLSHGPQGDGSLSAAKEAAQAEHERRIRSALTPTPDPVAEAARVLLEDTTIADKDAMNRAACEAMYLTGFMPSDLTHFDRGRIAALRALTKGGE